MKGVPAGEGLPSPDCHIDISRIDFDRAGLAADPFGREKRRAGAAESVEHDMVAASAILDRIGDQCTGLTVGCARRSSMRPALKVLAPA